jgi:capsular polysaccharide biosynthesis protein
VPEINVYDLLRHYAKYWLFIALSTIVGLAAGIAYTNLIQVPVYKSDATLILVDSIPSSTKDATQINNYLELLKSRRVLQPVITQNNLGQNYSELSKSITTSNDKDTEVVKISVSISDPQKSQEVLDDTITSFKREVKKLYDTDNIEVIDSASLPTEPANVRSTLQITLGAIAGFLFSIIVVFFIYDYRLSRAANPELFANTTATTKKKKTRKKKPAAPAGPGIMARIKRLWNRFTTSFSNHYRSFIKDAKDFFTPNRELETPKTTVKPTAKSKKKE